MTACAALLASTDVAASFLIATLTLNGGNAHVAVDGTTVAIVTNEDALCLNGAAIGTMSVFISVGITKVASFGG